MGQLNILLGAGFSKPAGLPLVGEINSYFNRDITEKILMAGSGEWYWADHANEVAAMQGKLSAEHFVFGFGLQEVLNAYGKVTNYEHLYDYLIKADEAFFKKCFDAGRKKMQAVLKLRDDNNLLDPFHSDGQDGKVVEMFNGLIIDLLQVPEVKASAIAEYKKFFELIKTYEQVRIFSLNHDLLLERLLQLNGIKFSDGFSEKDSFIIGEHDAPQRIFQNDFHENVKFYKLHGSDGLYGYRVAQEVGSVAYPTGELVYFKSDSHGSKHFAMRKDPATRKILQTHNIDPTPKFITGKNKSELIMDGNMYSKLFEHFSEEQKNTDELLIIGYSYGDDHIDSVIKSRKFKRVTNINPGPVYPYKNADEIVNKKFIPDL